MECWKDIPEFEGYYQVSDLGRVRSVDRHIPNSRGVGTRLMRGKILSPRVMEPYGHLLVLLSMGSKRWTKCVHRLVLLTFIGPCPPGQESCHNDGKSSHNHLTNLRWDTHTNNMLDTRKHGTCGGKPVRRSDGRVFISAVVASEETSVPRSGITTCCLGVQKTSGGYRWTYV